MRSVATGVPVRLLAAGAAIALLLAGCGDDGGEDRTTRERSQATDVAFTSCDEAECEGEIDGAKFAILMPESWNGTLLLYSHGYRQAEAAPPDFDEPSTEPDPAPGYSTGDTGAADALLDQGFALAGSAYASNGWAVEDGVAAGEALHDYFVENIADPDRTYVWGDSLGGLITQLIAERNPDWVAAAAPLCGVLAGPTANLDMALDVSYATKTLLAPEMELTGYDSFDDAVASWQLGYDAVIAAGGDIGTGVPKILMVASLVDAPTRTATYDGHDVESQVRARAESALTALGYSTYGRYDIEQRFGGNPSSNADVDYAARISDEERSLIDTVGGEGATDAHARPARGRRAAAGRRGRPRPRSPESGTPTGAIKDPTITLHTTADPLVLVQNETVFDQRASSNPDRTGDLVQLYSAPPATYDPEEGAPYGAGHCNFSADERIGVVTLLDQWARGGLYPAPAAVEAAMGQDNGIEPNYAAGRVAGRARRLSTTTAHRGDVVAAVRPKSVPGALPASNVERVTSDRGGSAVPAAGGGYDLDVVIPALDEELRLPRTLAALTARLGGTGLRCLVTVVDNGSEDGTAAVARAWSDATGVDVRVLSCPVRGKGAAVRTGVLATPARWVGFMDADLATSLDVMDDVLAQLADGADVLVGSRLLVKHGVVVTQEPLRQLGGWLFRRTCRLLVPTVSDTQCGFKFFAGRHVDLLFGTLVSTGWSFDVEVLARALRAGLDVRQLPVEWTHDASSRFRVVRDGVTTFTDVVRIRAALRSEPLPVAAVDPAGTTALAAP